MEATVQRTENEKAVALHLKWTYTIVPIVAGADKFFNLLVNWEKYLAPVISDILPFDAHIFMLIVGVIEIIAGIIVLIKPRLGAIIVAGWLLSIVINLVIAGYYDIAVRDAVMAIGAYSLYLLWGKNE